MPRTIEQIETQAQLNEAAVDMIKEYINETEHQGESEWWTEVEWTAAKKIMDDLILFIENYK